MIATLLDLLDDLARRVMFWRDRMSREPLSEFRHRQVVVVLAKSDETDPHLFV